MDVIGYYGGYAGSASWVVLIPIAVMIVMRMMSRRSMGNRPPGYPAQRFQGMPPGRGPVGAGPAPRQDRGIAPCWLPDPSGRHGQRYWSGTGWTDHVLDDGVPGTDPFPDPTARHQGGDPPEPPPPDPS